MARRKKEPKSVHRENIAAAASSLFMEKGITPTSMNEIAKGLYMCTLRTKKKLLAF